MTKATFSGFVLKAAVCGLVLLGSARAALAQGLKNSISGLGSTAAAAPMIMSDRVEYELDSKWVTFIGNVAIKYNGMELRADKIRYNEATMDAEAFGKATLVTEDGNVMSGEELKVNLKDKSGGSANLNDAAVSIQNIDIYSKPYRVLAESAERQPDNTYLIHDAVFTTCTNAPGSFHYHLKANESRLRPDRDLTMWGGVPYLFGVPFFYWPYYWKDLSRHYGFRFEPGYQSSWGGYLLSSYKLPLWRDRENRLYVDSKTSADYRTDRGWAFGELLEWSFGDDSKGWFSAYYTADDKDVPYGVDDEERYRLRFNHSWNATPRDQVLVQGIYVSDDRFLEDFFEKEYREMNQPDSYVSWTHYADSFSYGLLARARLNDFYDQVERLPEAWLTLNSLELGSTGLYIENRSYATYLNREFDERRDPLPESYDVFRADSETMLTMPTKLFGFLSVVPRAGYRGTVYSKTLEQLVSHESYTETTTNELGQVSSEAKTKETTTEKEGDADFRSVFEFGAEVSFKAFGMWQDSDGRDWRHVIEPYANYTFIPEPNLRPYELFQFDSTDEIDKLHSVRLGLRNRWQVREQNRSVLERFYLDVYTDVNLDPEEGEDAIDWLYGEFKYRPNTWMRFDVDMRYDVDESEVSRASFRLLMWHRIFGSDIEYRYRVDESSLLIGNMTWRINNDWSVNAYGRYEFETSQVEEIGTWIQRSYDCIAFRLYASVKPGYTLSDGREEDDDYKISFAAWLTEFTPARIREEDYR